MLRNINNLRPVMPTLPEHAVAYQPLISQFTFQKSSVVPEEFRLSDEAIPDYIEIRWCKALTCSDLRRGQTVDES